MEDLPGAFPPGPQPQHDSWTLRHKALSPILAIHKQDRFDAYTRPGSREHECMIRKNWHIISTPEKINLELTTLIFAEHSRSCKV